MKKQVFWIALIILIGAILFMLYFNFCTRDKVEIDREEVQTETVTQSDYNRLRSRIIDLENKVDELENRIDRPTSTRTTTRQTVTQAEPRPAPAPAKPEPREPDKKADLSHIRNVSGEIIFCVMANNDGGMHFPQYALERGVTFNGIRSNTTDDGNNWVVNPTETMRGDYGVTIDGTFFVSHEVIEATMKEPLINLAIKAGFTGWEADDMTKEGSYWVYKTR